jgi:phage shock protein PspC (stress-responsive transcriptional regulator)
MSITDDLERLQQLHQSGVLSDAEFARAKEKLLANEACGGAGLEPSLQKLNQFRRSKQDQWLGGVCGGLARLTGMESWIWRLCFVLFSFYFGVGLIIYLLAWIFVPEEA